MWSRKSGTVPSEERARGVYPIFQRVGIELLAGKREAYRLPGQDAETVLMVLQALRILREMD